MGNFTGLVIEVTNGGMPVTTGVYNIAASGSAMSGYAATISTNASCVNAGGTATSGTVTLETVSASSVRGSFTITVPDQAGSSDHLVGSFEAPLCLVHEIPQSQEDGGFFTCHP
jgi:hypothetical protein